jgi:hypothetical protein
MATIVTAAALLCVTGSASARQGLSYRDAVAAVAREGRYDVASGLAGSYQVRGCRRVSIRTFYCMLHEKDAKFWGGTWDADWNYTIFRHARTGKIVTIWGQITGWEP